MEKNTSKLNETAKTQAKKSKKQTKKQGNLKEKNQKSFYRLMFLTVIGVVWVAEKYYPMIKMSVIVDIKDKKDG